MKGAIREIRKDNAFLARQQLQEQIDRYNLLFKFLYNREFMTSFITGTPNASAKSRNCSLRWPRKREKFASLRRLKSETDDERLCSIHCYFRFKSRQLARLLKRPKRRRGSGKSGKGSATKAKSLDVRCLAWQRTCPKIAHIKATRKFS